MRPVPSDSEATVASMELCPYCEEDGPLDAAGECSRCERRNELTASAAYFAATVGRGVADERHERVAHAVLTEAPDHQRRVVLWARGIVAEAARRSTVTGSV